MGRVAATYSFDGLFIVTGIIGSLGLNAVAVSNARGAGAVLAVTAARLRVVPATRVHTDTGIAGRVGESGGGGLHGDGLQQQVVQEAVLVQLFQASASLKDFPHVRSLPDSRIVK